jgi:L-seryl-tRNA(Ser) seleniumtransferase
MLAMQSLALSYLNRTATKEIIFWKMATINVSELRERAKQIVTAIAFGEVCELESIPGAGSAPGATIESAGVAIKGDYLAKLRMYTTPIIARVKDSKTFIDLRTVQPDDDQTLIQALRSLNS